MSVKTGTVNENSAATLLDQLQLAPEIYAIAGDIGSIVVTSFDTDSGEQVKTYTIDGDSDSPPLSAVILDDLTTVGWTRDKIGYNVRLPLDGSYWPEGDRVYRLEIKYIPTSGDPIYSLWELQATRVYSE